MGKFTAVLRLTRIEHSAMLVVAVIAAELLAGSLPTAQVLILSLITPIFISMASFAVNDYFDVKVDRLNMKNRPLVTQELRPIDAVYVAVACFAVGITASALINTYTFVIAALFAGLAVLYSYKLKEVFLLGNAYIALTMVIPFVFGNYVVSESLVWAIVPISVMVFMSGLAREIHGTIRDYGGDVKVRKVRTLPRVIGVHGASVSAFALYAIAIAISGYLFSSVPPFMLNWAYAVPIIVSDLMLLYVGLGYVYSAKRKFYEKTRNVSLLAMGLALIAILASAAFYL
jgi:4-hydroxybenzoate polyprenyltransferase